MGVDGAYSGGAGDVVADVGALLLGRSLASLGADAGFVATLTADGGAIEVSRVTPWSAAPVHLRFPSDAPYPIAESLRSRRQIVIADNDELACDHPGLVRVKPEDHACASLPLVGRDGEIVGAINVGFEEPRAITEAELAAIEAVARHVTSAMTAACELQRELERLADR